MITKLPPMIKVPGTLPSLHQAAPGAAPQVTGLKDVYFSQTVVPVGGPYGFGTYLKNEPRKQGVIGSHKQNFEIKILARHTESPVRNLDKKKGVNNDDYNIHHSDVTLAPTYDEWMEGLLALDGGRGNFAKDDCPAVNINLIAAIGYNDWLNEITGNERLAMGGMGLLRLPSREELLHAAAGPNGDFKYGTRTGELTPELAHYLNATATGPVRAKPGILYPEGELFGMAGNVSEWTSSLIDPTEHEPYRLIFNEVTWRGVKQQMFARQDGTFVDIRESGDNLGFRFVATALDS